MNRKGFTLVELLAVIIILAVIALIATPIIMNVIENSRKEAFRSSVEFSLDAAEYYENENDGVVEIDITSPSLELKNNRFTSGELVFDGAKWKAENLTDGNYCGTGYSGDIDVVKGDCSSEAEPANIYYLSEVPSASATTSFWGSTITRNQVESINFTTDNTVPSGAIDSWDAGLVKDGKVMAWYTDTDSNGLYEVVIGTEGAVYAPANSANLFKDFRVLKTLNLNNLNTSKATTMMAMFSYTGSNNTAFTLDLGSTFDTSNVTLMSNMFNHTGNSNTSFTLSLGSKFNTSKVTNMSSMFSYTGSASTVFTLDLKDKFDTSNVTNMLSMFNYAGNASTVFTLDLKDKFDTSNVTNMGYIFYSVGYSNPNFTLDLGSKFSTSNATSVSYMFVNVAKSNPNFILDLRGLDFDKVTTQNTTTFSTGNASHKMYTDNGNNSFVTGKGFSGTIINCSTSSC